MGWPLRRCLLPEGVGDVVRVGNPQPRLSHIVLLSSTAPLPGSSDLPPLPPQSLMPQKILSPLCPGQLRDPGLARRSAASSPGRRGWDRPNGDQDATTANKPLGPSPANLGRWGLTRVTFSLGANSKRAAWQAAGTTHCYSESPSGVVEGQAGGEGRGRPASGRAGPGRLGVVEPVTVRCWPRSSINGKRHVCLRKQTGIVGRGRASGGLGTD